jgi:hypothetical protein
MVNENRPTGPSADSGYASNHSRTGSSQDSKGKEPARDSPGSSLVLSLANSNNVPGLSERSLSPPLFGRDLTSNSESIAHIHDGYASMSSSENKSSQSNIPDEFLSSEALFSSNSSLFPTQPDDLMSGIMELDYVNWDQLPQGGSTSNYAM